MNRSELKALAEKNNHYFGDRGAFPLIEITAENMRLLQEKFPFAYEFLKEFGRTYISKKTEWFQFFTVKDRFTDKEIISDTEIEIAWFECGAQYKSVIYSNEQNCFKFMNGQIIADIVDLLGNRIKGIELKFFTSRRRRKACCRTVTTTTQMWKIFINELIRFSGRSTIVPKVCLNMLCQMKAISL